MSLCMIKTVGLFVHTVADIEFLTVPAYLFFRTYIISHEVVTFQNKLKASLKEIQIEDLAVLRMEFGKLSWKTSHFNATHKYIIASSVIITGTIAVSFGYTLFKAETNSYNSTWIFLYLPVVIFNYGMMLYAPAILHDAVSYVGIIASIQNYTVPKKKRKGKDQV